MRVARPSPTLLHTLVCVVLSALCAGLYVRTVDYPMQYDDLVFVRDNPLITQPWTADRYTEARRFVQDSKAAGIANELITTALLRPVAYASFRANYLFDGFRPRWFRVANIAIHATNAMLVYALLTTLLAKMSIERRRMLIIAAGTAMLFAAHPLATESVTFITQRFTSLAAMFYLGALVLHFRGWMKTAALAVVLGMLSKSCTITAPVIAVMLDGVLLRTPWRAAVRRAWPLLATLPVVPALVLFTVWAQGTALTAAVEISNGQQLPVDHFSYAITQPTVMLEYLRKILCPTGLNVDPEWPLYHSLTAWPVLMALLVVAALFVLAVWLHHRKQWSVGLAAALWFFGTLIVSSGLVPLPDWIADHRTYLASVAVLALAALVLRHPLVIVTAVIALSAVTVQRNEVWRSAISLWEDTVAQSPGKARAWCNLGTAYGEAQRREEALRCFRQAVELEPRYETAHVNAAFILNDLNRFGEAAAQCAQLVAVSPEAATHVEVAHCQAVARIGLGQVQQGLAQLETIATTVPDYRPTQVMLGVIYSRLHQPLVALRYWRNAQRLQPDPGLARMIDAAERAAREQRGTASLRE